LEQERFKGKLRPFLDALIGFHYLSTDTSIRGKDGWDNWDDEISSNNYNDIAFSSGAGGGIMFCVCQKEKKTAKEMPSPFTWIRAFTISGAKKPSI
jgi:hypothetical protein